jgi:hypothetical protein
MEIQNILFFVIISVLLILVIRYYMQDANTLTSLIDGRTMQKIEAADLPQPSDSGNSSNYSYSTWFYIDDWNYRYGESKVIFGKMTLPASGSNSDPLEPCPSVVLGPTENNLVISLAVYPGVDSTPEAGSNFIIHTCGVANVPIQKWVNLLVSVYGRTLDIYIDGKLVRTCLLPGVAKIETNSPIYITPNGGFSGWTSKFQYWTDSTDPQKAWDIYKKGYGGSSIGFLGGYTIKLSLMHGDIEENSIQI